jgi:hypothetical protein
MKIDFVPLSEALVPASRAFNERLRERGAPTFLLPEAAPPPPPPANPGGIQLTHYVGLDETGAVRGGVLLTEHHGWLNGQVTPMLNIQSPLSEGTVDRAYSGVGLKMLGFITRRNPLAYAVGMGSEQNPFARLLQAAGWSVTRVPFQCAVIRPAPFLREIGPLRHSGRRILARLAAASGLGSVAGAAWRWAHRRTVPPGYSFEAIACWPNELDGELDRVWNECSGSFDFALVRDARAIHDLHPASETRLRRWLLRDRGRLVGWSAGLYTAMEGNPHFGDLRVGTILDALAPPNHLGALLLQTYDALRGLGADLVIVNCTHTLWRERLRRLGFLEFPSNFLLAISKPLAAALQTKPALGRVYVTRADGDGRIHL